MKDRLYKKISIGLNLNENEDDILTFLETYQDYLRSILSDGTLWESQTAR